MEYVLPFVGSLEFFLGFWSLLPQPLRSYVVANLFFFSIMSVVRRFSNE